MLAAKPLSPNAFGVTASNTALRNKHETKALPGLKKSSEAAFVGEFQARFAETGLDPAGFL
ncbi:hypothetical protein [Roseateles violae]|uniref:Uncharacterized protein n=1 Tax=Roseateles violae TaxID=3058042 RepID=A0ABT8DS25_9BURK|nr:hypothetical protein [Pelomonas sp. PFR6]MDN3921131.1 hypothetical protein [Pelomonas sp. PFR6]